MNPDANTINAVSFCSEEMKSFINGGTHAPDRLRNHDVARTPPTGDRAAAV